MCSHISSGESPFVSLSFCKLFRPEIILKPPTLYERNGAEDCFFREDAGEILNRIAAGAKGISLAKEPDFQELYVKFMDFPVKERK